jgi:hypothetical protein
MNNNIFVINDLDLPQGSQILHKQLLLEKDEILLTNVLKKYFCACITKLLKVIIHFGQV